MGVASLVLGIVSIVIGLIPFCGVIAFIPAIIGLILGIVAVIQKSKKNESKGMEIAGIILSAIAMVCIIFWLGVTSTIQDSDNDTKSNSISVNTNANTVKTYDLGETGEVDNWEITVLSSENKKTIGKNSYFSKTTENNYIIVKLKIKNLSTEAKPLLTTASQITSSYYGIYTRSLLELYDGKSIYVADYDLDSYVDNDFNILFDEINPNTSIIYYAVFETDKPSTEKDYSLKLDDNDNILFKIK